MGEEDSRLQRHQLERESPGVTWISILAAAGAYLGNRSGDRHYTTELAKRGYNNYPRSISPPTWSTVFRNEWPQLSEPTDSCSSWRRTYACRYPASSFDTVLLMGPLYHLISRNDRLLVLKRVFDYLVDNGVLMSSMIAVRCPGRSGENKRS